MKLRALVILSLSLATTLSATNTAFAGGYDTPMLYTARHMGMGGAAQAYVDDPSAMFHNPAGLMGTDRLTITADFSLLTGFITASPNTNAEATSIESERTIAPFFLLGVSGRLTEWLTAGFAVYPVASAGAEFKYDDGFGATTTDRTSLVFLELSPGLAFQIPSYPKLSIGIGYRITIVQLERFQQTVDPNFPDTPDTGIDFDISGASFAGFRFGLQWRALDYLQVGVSYRHKTETDVDGDGTVIGTEWPFVGTTFTLPSRLAFGLRSDFADFGVALDVEYAFNSQNEQAGILIGSDEDTAMPLANVFDWTNAVTIRAGVEYRLLDGQLPIRAGYVWDQKTSSPVYSSAFGTPPGPTHVITLGTGWSTPTWSLDVAYAYRQGNADVTREQFERREAPGGLGECQFCAHPGDYEISLHGIYLTFSYNLRSNDDEEEAAPDYPTAPAAEPETDAYEPEPEPEPATSPAPGGGEDTGGGMGEDDAGGEAEEMSDENSEEEALPMSEGTEPAPTGTDDAI